MTWVNDMSKKAYELLVFMVEGWQDALRMRDRMMRDHKNVMFE